MRNKLLWSVAAAALVVPMAAMAQETTTTIKGTVTQGGQPVAGAQITVTNVPSGTKSTSVTQADGGFSLPGLRPGGPYTVDVASPLGNTSVTDIYTVLQQDFVVPIDLPVAGTGPQDVVVTASSIARAGSLGNGPATVLGQRAVSKVASVNRDIREIERRSPFATLDFSQNNGFGAVNFAGTNPRFNRFTINGVTVGDQFGLNADASPTNRGPIPFDAIGQVSVQVAPYDFRQDGFTGGVVDVALLAGTNDFHVNGFYSESTDGLQGDRIGSNHFNKQNYNSKTYGATISGPLIKDKLFFMVSGERNTDPRPLSPNAANQVPNLTDATVANVVSIAQSKYSYNAGSVLALTQNEDEKIVGQINWNISDRQKLQLSYVNAYDQQDALQNTSTTTSSPSLGLSSDAYRTTELLRAGIVQLNSDWTDNFSTEARGFYRSYVRGQNPLMGLGFAQFRVCTDPVDDIKSLTGCSSGTPVVAFGPDISRQTNTLFTDAWDGSFLARLRLNNHDLKLLAELEENHDVDNFLQYSAGGYYFDSIADFQRGLANSLQYATTLNGQPNGAQENFHYDTWGFGIQDDWQVSDALSVSYGVREDLYGEEDSPKYDPYFQQRFGFPNTKTFKGLSNFEPRVSFNWRPTSILKIRGGFGIFGGGNPDIYLGNSFGNTILSNQVTFNRSAAVSTNPAQATTATCTPAAAQKAGVCTAALNNVTGTSIPASVTSYVQSPTTVATQLTAELAPNFKPPSVYKASLSGDIRLFGIDFGADYLYTKTREQIIFTDIRSVQVGVLPDGRPRYNAVTLYDGQIATNGLGTDTNYDVLLSDTTKGRSHIGVIRFNKDFPFGLSIGGSYTLEDVKDQAAAPASTPLSNYGYQAFGDPNIPAYGTSTTQTAWQFKYNIGFDHAFFRDYRTVLQLFGDTRAGQPYSFTMMDAVNSSSVRSPVFGTISQDYRYLIYVPTGDNDPRVSYDSAATQAALNNVINNTDLKNYRGRIAPKNDARSRAFTRIDLHLEQEIPTFVGKSRFSVFGDIENLPNLLNHNWGGLRQIAYPYVGTLVSVQCLSAATPTGTAPGAGVANTNPTQACAQYRYSTFTAPNVSAINIAQSLYLIRIGARFKF